jgi:hypothetical protein
MSNSGFQLTNAGLAKASIALPGGPYIHVSQFKVGSAFGYTPAVDGSETALHGSILYTSTPSTYSVSADGSIQIVLIMDKTVGPFSFGEIGLFLDDNTMFASCTFSTLQEKVQAVGNQAGVTYLIRANILLKQTPAIVQVSVLNNMNLLEVANWSSLISPLLQPSQVNAAIIHEQNFVSESVLVVRDGDNNWKVEGYTELFIGSIADAGASATTSTITHPQLTAVLMPKLPSTKSEYVAKFREGSIRRLASRSGSTLTFTPVLGTAPTGIFSIWVDTNVLVSAPARLPSAIGVGVDTVTGVCTPTVAQYFDGLTIRLAAAGPNTTTIPTFNPDGLGAKVIVNKTHGALLLNELSGDQLLMYNLVLDKWVLAGSSPVLSVAGKVGNVTLIASDTFGTAWTQATLTNLGQLVNGPNYINSAGAPVQSVNGLTGAVATGIGYGQTWQNVTGSRSFGINYTNSTGKPIAVSVVNAGVGATLFVDSLLMGYSSAGDSSGIHQLFAIIPPGSYYSITGSFTTWYELR